MAITEEQVYAALGIEKPADKPEAAVPATIEGANEQGATAPAGAEDGGQIARATDVDGGQIARATDVDGGSSETGDSTSSGASRHLPLEGKALDAEGGRQGAVPSGANDGGADGGRPMTDPTDAGTSDARPYGAQNDGKGGQSREERAEQARLRREREKKAAVDAAVSDAVKKAKEAHDAELAEIFAAMGATDRFHGGKPITNLKEFQEWQAANQAAGLNRKLKAGELTAEDLQAVVDASPVMQQAKAALADIQAREAAAKQQQTKAEFEKIMERELAEINELDPGVKTLEDAMNLPTGREFVRLVNERGLSYIEAFKLANIDRLTRARSLGAAEGKAQQQHSKDHLRAIGIAGGPSVDVPPETVRLYRDLNPDMTMDQIREHYVKTMGIR